MMGFSGAVLERSYNGKVVVKRSPDARLLEQGERQQSFRTRVPGLRACSVLATGFDANGYSLTMPFIDGVCPLLHIKPMLTTIFEYIHEGVTKSTMGNVPANLLLARLDTLERRIWHSKSVPPIWFQPLSECRRVFADGLTNIPLGQCHGDFTFTNMLQTDSELILVDFL